MNIKNIKIRTMMISSFFAVMVFFLFIVLVAFFEGNELIQKTETIIEHPIIVRQAVDDFALDMYKIHWRFETALEQENYQQMKPYLEIVKSSETDAIGNLDILYERYLGPKEDIDNLAELFNVSKSNRDDVIRLIQAGNFEQADLINNESSNAFGSDHLTRLTDAIDKVSIFAANKANEIYTSSEKSVKSLQTNLIILGSAFLITTLIMNIMLFRSIRRPLNELSAAASSFHQGDMSARCLYESKNEFGALSYSFNTMLDRIQKDIELSVSEIRYRRLFETAQDGIIILDADTGQIDDINPYLIDMLGYSKEELVDKYIWQIGTFDDFANNKDKFLKLKTEGYIRYENMPLQTKDGRTINVEFVSNVYSADNKSVIQCNIRDISERIKATKALKESEERYSSYIENAPDGIFIVDDNGRFIEANIAASNITGYSNEELLNMTISDNLPEESIEAGVNHFKKLLETGKSNGEMQFIHKDGAKGWWSVDAVKLTEHRFMSFIKDITEQKNAEEKVLYLSYHDQLTGLYNRRFYEEELNRLDTKRNFPLTIVMGDVNGLKLINDSLGHAMGDELLKTAAEVIKMGCRADDIIARLGGDEFVIILPKTDTLEAEKFIKRINELSIKAKKGYMDISISFGYKTKSNKEEKIQDIFKLAEDMMYRNKLSESSTTRFKTVDVVMETLFKKYKREQSHSIKVSEICKDIATKMGYNAHDVDQIRTAGLMHDIGKIDIDGKILNKPQKLNEDEWNEIKRHPEKGYRILSLVDQFTEIAKYVLEHHERWDGTGYLRGLKGEEISLPARIITVADSYDAMTTDRSYAKALSKEEAINEIIRCSGTHFDPEIAALFVKMISTT